MSDPLALLDRYPWLLFLVVLVAALKWIGTALAESSESWARVLGPLGSRWRARGQRAIRVDDLRRAREAADLEDMRRQVDYLSSRVQTLSDGMDLRDDYMQYDAEWHATIELRRAELGWVFPPPPHQTYAEWRRARKIE